MGTDLQSPKLPGNQHAAVPAGPTLILAAALLFLAGCGLRESPNHSSAGFSEGEIHTEVDGLFSGVVWADDNEPEFLLLLHHTGRRDGGWPWCDVATKTKGTTTDQISAITWNVTERDTQTRLVTFNYSTQDDVNELVVGDTSYDPTIGRVFLVDVIKRPIEVRQITIELPQSLVPVNRNDLTNPRVGTGSNPKDPVQRLHLAINDLAQDNAAIMQFIRDACPSWSF